VAASIVDCHNDLVLELVHRELMLGETNPFREHWLPPLRAGGVGLQVCPVYPASGLVPDGALRETLNQVLSLRHAIVRNPGQVAPVEYRDDLDEVRDGDRLGVMISMEGMEALGRDPWLIEVYRDLGVRMASLTWEYRNFFADGCSERDGGGLSGLGRILARRMAELEIIIDLAHTSRQTFWDVLEEVPEADVIVSHSGCRALHDIPRNLDDDQLRALAARGGVFCVMLLPFALGEGSFFEVACAHVMHAIDVVGPGHVGLGGDFSAQLERLLPGPSPLDVVFGWDPEEPLASVDMGGPEDYPTLVGHLRERLSEEELAAVLGGNLLTFFDRALPERRVSAATGPPAPSGRTTG